MTALESKLTLLGTWQAKWIRDKVLWQKILYSEPADWKDGRLMSLPSYWVWMPGSFKDQRWGEVRKQSIKAINLANIS